MFESWMVIPILIVVAGIAYYIIKKKKDEEGDVSVPYFDPVEEETEITKYALIVGINKYASPGMDLAGCVNDANSMKDLLTECFGFEAFGIKMLTDKEATKANILAGLRWLIAQGKEGVELVYYHSGHGTQVFDESGDEADELDEVLVSHDHDWNNPLSDDDVAAVFKQLPQGAFLSMVCDTCHSGSMTKSVVRNIAVPKDMAEKMEGKVLKIRKFGMKKDISKAEQRHILLSGCKDDQYSSEAEIGGKRQGALTYNFVKECRKASGPWSAIHANLIATMGAEGWSQDPQLTGAADLQARTVFGG